MTKIRRASLQLSPRGNKTSRGFSSVLVSLSRKPLWLSPLQPLYHQCPFSSSWSLWRLFRVLFRQNTQHICCLYCLMRHRGASRSSEHWNLLVPFSTRAIQNTSLVFNYEYKPWEGLEGQIRPKMAKETLPSILYIQPLYFSDGSRFGSICLTIFVSNFRSRLCAKLLQNRSKK